MYKGYRRSNNSSKKIYAKFFVVLCNTPKLIYFMVAEVVA
jgi:hypothetical protein